MPLLKGLERAAQPAPAEPARGGELRALGLEHAMRNAEIAAVEQAVSSQEIKAHEPRAPRERGGGIIRRAAGSRRIDRQHLPPPLTGAREELREAMCGRAEIPRAVGARKTGRVQKDTARTFLENRRGHGGVNGGRYSGVLGVLLGRNSEAQMEIARTEAITPSDTKGCTLMNPDTSILPPTKRRIIARPAPR